jgi:hypothetical protein
MRPTIRSSSHLLAISLVVAAAVALFAVYYANGAQGANQASSEPMSFLNDCGVYPTTTLVNGTASANGGLSSLLASANQGSALGPPFDSRGLPTTHFDNGDISVSLYRITGGTPAPVIAATVTNTGQQIANLTDFRVYGMIPGPPGYSWVSVLQAVAINPGPDPTVNGNCTWPEPPATTQQALSPAQSLTLYLTGTLSFQGQSIEGFQAQVQYHFPGIALGYRIDTNVSWTK